jgi:3-methyladenine DNA glycosylase/8-oxoguanine DNA glycosylase
MVKTTIALDVPTEFNFRRTVYSHGWYSLPPFALDEENWILRRVFDLDNAQPVLAEIKEAENAVQIEIAAYVNAAAHAKIRRDARHILQLDEDFSDFYALTNDDANFLWVAECGAGRLLRSPTVFEDLVKTICTTNCSWALTKKMVTNLVEKLGEPTDDGKFKSFPTPQRMAEMPADFYRDEIRAGYRAAYFPELANKVASGELDVESWLTTDLPTKDLKKQIKSVKGCGDYAAENLLKLLGRYDGLALDSWLRMRFAKLHNNEQTCDDKQIYRHYEPFGEWQGLALWCDATRDWL